MQLTKPPRTSALWNPKVNAAEGLIVVNLIAYQAIQSAKKSDNMWKESATSDNAPAAYPTINSTRKKENVRPPIKMSFLLRVSPILVSLDPVKI